MRYLKKVFVFIISFLAFSSITNAVVKLMGATKSNPQTNFDIYLMCNNRTQSGSFDVIYDASVLELVDARVNYRPDAISVESNSYGHITITMEESNSIGDAVTFTFKSKDGITIPTKTNIYMNGTADGEKMSSTKEVTIKNLSADLSSNANLSNITITDKDGKNVPLSPSFNSSTVNYSASTYSSSLTINVTKADSSAEVRYPGEIKLSYGSHNFTIEVTAADGTVKVYYLTINRMEAPNPKSSDSSLKNLVVEGEYINFNSNTLNYSVKTDQESYNVIGYVNDSKASISTPNGNSGYLDYNETKTIPIIVTAEDGSSTTYKVTITRNAKPSANPDPSNTNNSNNNNNNTSNNNNNTNNNNSNNNNSNNKGTKSANNYLKTLKLEETDFDFDKNILEYDFDANYATTKLNITAIPEDGKAKVNIIGNENFKLGKNVVKIEVIAEDGSKRTYILNIVKNDDSILIANDEKEIIKAINNPKDYYFIKVAISEEPVTISSSILEALKKEEKSIVYLFKGENGISYRIQLSGHLLQDTSGITIRPVFDSKRSSELNKIVNNNDYLPIRFEYTGNYPGLIYLDLNREVYNLNEEQLNFYKVNYSNKTLETRFVSSDDDYYSIDVNDLDSEYILTKYDNQPSEIVDHKKEEKSSSKNNSLNKILLGIVGVLLISVTIAGIRLIIKKKKAL